LSIKTFKNGPQKLLIIGPDPFISQSSPDHSPQPIINFSYYEISGPDICSLICGFLQSSTITNIINVKKLLQGIGVIHNQPGDLAELKKSFKSGYHLVKFARVVDF
jgi:hypothetical protein